jgi:protein TonB
MARAMITTRLTVSLLCAALLHGAAFGVVAVVLSGPPAVPAAPPPPVDVDLVEVTAPRPEPLADSAPGPALAPARLVVPAHHRAPVRQVAQASDPSTIDPRAAADDAPGPSLPVPPVAAAPVGAASPRAPGAAAPSTGATVSAQPRYRTNPKPEYPLPSVRRREEGVVLVNVVVQPDGLPGAISLNRSSGHPLLDRAALDVVRRWTFEPARAAGLPVSSVAVVPVRFDLSEAP